MMDYEKFQNFIGIAAVVVFTAFLAVVVTGQNPTLRKTSETVEEEWGSSTTYHYFDLADLLLYGFFGLLVLLGIVFVGGSFRRSRG